MPEFVALLFCFPYTEHNLLLHTAGQLRTTPCLCAAATAAWACCRAVRGTHARYPASGAANAHMSSLQPSTPASPTHRCPWMHLLLPCCLALLLSCCCSVMCRAAHQTASLTQQSWVAPRCLWSPRWHPPALQRPLRSGTTSCQMRRHPLLSSWRPAQAAASTMCGRCAACLQLWPPAAPIDSNPPGLLGPQHDALGGTPHRDWRRERQSARRGACSDSYPDSRAPCS